MKLLGDATSNLRRCTIAFHGDRKPHPLLFPGKALENLRRSGWRGAASCTGTDRDVNVGLNGSRPITVDPARTLLCGGGEARSFHLAQVLVPTFYNRTQKQSMVRDETGLSTLADEAKEIPETATGEDDKSTPEDKANASTGRLDTPIQTSTLMRSVRFRTMLSTPPSGCLSPCSIRNGHAVEYLGTSSKIGNRVIPNIRTSLGRATISSYVVVRQVVRRLCKTPAFVYFSRERPAFFSLCIGCRRVWGIPDSRRYRMSGLWHRSRSTSSLE